MWDLRGIGMRVCGIIMGLATFGSGMCRIIMGSGTFCRVDCGMSQGLRLCRFEM